MQVLPEGWAPPIRYANGVAADAGRIVFQLEATAVVAFKSGSGGTATTFKSRFKTKSVSAVAFTFAEAPKTIFTSKQPVTVIVRATTLIEGKTEGVNGVCAYVTGANNNGQGTSLQGTRECDNTPVGGLSAQTRTLNGLAGYAVFELSVTKTGGLILTASSEDADGTTGAVGRDGQTFAPATFKTNVKP